MTGWRTQSAPDGIGIWLTCEYPTHVKAIAPPGVVLTGAFDQQHLTSGGWQVATWRRDDDAYPLIDIEAPMGVHTVDTSYVVSIIDATLADTVYDILVEQLQLARRFGRPAAGAAPREDLVQRSAMTCAWLEGEIADAFPRRTTGLRRQDLGAPYPLKPWGELQADEAPSRLTSSASLGIVIADPASGDVDMGTARRVVAAARRLAQRLRGQGRADGSEQCAAQDTTDFPALV